MNISEETGILDYLAENLLLRDYSISYLRKAGKTVLLAEGALEQQLFIPAEGEFSEVLKTVRSIADSQGVEKVLIPVASRREEKEVRELLQRQQIIGVEVYLLSKVERFIFLRSEFQKRRSAGQ